MLEAPLTQNTYLILYTVILGLLRIVGYVTHARRLKLAGMLVFLISISTNQNQVSKIEA
jgi:hypothetical protein